MESMSNLKYDAIIKSGIEVINRYEIPEELIPADGRVEIDAKVSPTDCLHIRPLH
jgi:GTP cyclohydrolase II